MENPSVSKASPLFSELTSIDLRIFEAMPGNSILLDTDAPNYTIIAVTRGMIQRSGIAKEQLVNKPFFEPFPANPFNPEDPNTAGQNIVLQSFEYVITHKDLHQLPLIRYDLENGEGLFTELYWNVYNRPVLDEKGNVLYIIHTSEDITQKVKAEQREERVKSIEQSHNLLLQMPLAIAIIKGAKLEIDLANEHMINLWGRGKGVLNKPIKEALPEIEEQGFIKLLTEVKETGIPYEAYERPVKFIINGKQKLGYYNFVYQPYYEEDKTKASGILIFASEVTDKIEAKKSLKESEERFRVAVDAIEGILWTNNFKGQMEGEQPGWTKLTGQSYEEYKGYGWVSSVHPDDVQATIDAWNEAVHECKPFIFEHRLRVKDGSWRLFSIRSIPLLNTDGSVREWVGVHTDITESKQAEEALKQSEQQVRALIESAPFPIGVYIGKEMHIQFANQSIINIWGKGPDVVGRKYAEVLPELANQEIFEQLDKVFTTGFPFHVKNQRVDIAKEGKLETYYFNYNFTPLLDAQSNIYGVMNTAADVTDLALAKQKVEQRERNLRNIILQAPVAMCILKESGYIVEIANDRMFEIWGKPGDEVMNKPIFEGLPEAKEQGLEALLNHVYTTGETFRAFEMAVNLPRSGKLETTYLNFVYEPFYEIEGIISGIMAVAVEVTEQVLARQKIEEVVTRRTKELAQANEALLRTNQELERSNVNLEEFAYAASHDLKEPIRKIHTFSDRIKSSMGARMNEQETIYFQRMEAATKRMNSLIEDLLSYSQVSIRPRIFDEVNMNGLMDMVLSDLDMEVEEKRAIITVDKLFTVKGYPRQLQQAFQNLVGNALKYSKPGVAPQIHISCSKVTGKDTGLLLAPEEQLKKYYIVSIKDNGIGFEQSDADRIFNVFTRLHGNAEYKGTGVGLSIVRKVIQNHNGYISAQSEPGQGATFKVFLPA